MAQVAVACDGVRKLTAHSRVRKSDASRFVVTGKKVGRRREQKRRLTPRKGKERMTARAVPASPPGERRRRTDHISQPPPRSTARAFRFGFAGPPGGHALSFFVVTSARLRMRFSCSGGEQDRPLAAYEGQRATKGCRQPLPRKESSRTRPQPPPSPRERTVHPGKVRAFAFLSFCRPPMPPRRIQTLRTHSNRQVRITG